MVGIDIGRVIIGSDTDNPNQFFEKNYLITPEIKDAFDSIRKIVFHYQQKNVFLVSKCGELIQKRTLAWLNHNKFHQRTNFFRPNVLFCRERKEKRYICEANGIRIFIDDRYSVLKHLLDLDELFLFKPIAEELKMFDESVRKNKISLVTNWKEVIEKIL